jgi:hypothetical protein
MNRRVRPPSPFAIVPVDDARRLTGLDATELHAASQVQLFTRVFADGRTESAYRVPRALLLDAQPES